jgi:hypothetical protein
MGGMGWYLCREICLAATFKLLATAYQFSLLVFENRKLINSGLDLIGGVLQITFFLLRTDKAIMSDRQKKRKNVLL